MAHVHSPIGLVWRRRKRYAYSLTVGIWPLGMAAWRGGSNGLARARHTDVRLRMYMALLMWPRC
jgi:hypothetical protein